MHGTVRSLAALAAIASLVSVGTFVGSALVAPTPAAADTIYQPIGPWNGHRIYLSPARHTDTGHRGECGGRSENVMAANTAWHAANGDHYLDVRNATARYRNLRTRGYQVRIGDGTLSSAIANSNAWGSHRHIAIHSNARIAPCTSTDASRHGTVAIYASPAGKKLSASLRDALTRSTPGSRDSICSNLPRTCTTIRLGELYRTKAAASYLETEFHTWDRGAVWAGDGRRWAWRIGKGVDVDLDYPGGAKPTTRSALESVPGFRLVDSALDEAQFDREERAREQLVARCMSERGLPYTPTPAKRVTGEAAPLPSSDPDPNQRYASTLSPAQRAVYYTTLIGAKDPYSELDQGPIGGCVGEAIDTIPGVYALASRLGAELNRLRASTHTSTLAATNEDASRVAVENAFAARHRGELDAHTRRISQASATIDSLTE